MKLPHNFSQLSTRSVRNKKPPAMRVEGSKVWPTRPSP